MRDDRKMFFHVIQRKSEEAHAVQDEEDLEAEARKGSHDTLYIYYTLLKPKSREKSGTRVEGEEGSSCVSAL